jgi:MoaA/NifB/PqqE/SkfB family radical SAM enzyme
MDGRWIDLRLGYACNNRCRFCDQGDFRRERGDASTAEVEEKLRALSGRAEGIWLAGGEVSLRPDLPALMRVARQVGFRRVGIQTNGRILAAPLAASGLRAAGLTDVQGMLAGHNAELHDFLTQEPGSWKQAVVGFRRAVQAGLQVGLSTVLSRSVLPSLPELARLSLSLGVHRHRFLWMREEGEAQKAVKTLLPRYRLAEEPLHTALELLRQGGIPAETVGVPLCFLGGKLWAAADRSEDAAPQHENLMGGESKELRRQGPPCTACSLRHSCAGPYEGYTRRWGWDEFVPVQAEVSAAPAEGDPPKRAGRPVATAPRQARFWKGGDPVPAGWGSLEGDRIYFPIGAPCTRSCSFCAVRPLAGVHWKAESGRKLRQRLVRAAGEGPRHLIFAGASCWEHPELPELIREATRLGFAPIEVWAPLYPLAKLEQASVSKLAGLSRVITPALQDSEAGEGTVEEEAEALRRLRSWLPKLEILQAPRGASPASLYRAEGWLGNWAGCQPEMVASNPSHSS